MVFLPSSSSIVNGSPSKSHLRVCLAVDSVPDVKEKIFKFTLRVPWVLPCPIQSLCTQSATLDCAGAGRFPPQPQLEWLCQLDHKVQYISYI